MDEIESPLSEEEEGVLFAHLGTIDSDSEGAWRLKYLSARLFLSN